ncbi:hypothetical protein D8Y22_08940 [Salinadaptatus halalkaliphilus]|uniref:Uncharacterized protein n=1 Tax=Salinadaptatus halalkaliphilus TaxID=2419781 RepID=A0A4S3TME7_9EURY|nr:hypothetical protein [Salinadaptatus halalkaliphilus]THE65306.1 hypothetical protein D8Y22_08940 [Salinadaptatus halalkaliphilus]
MNRRRFLGGACGIVSAIAAGCLGELERTGSSPTDGGDDLDPNFEQCDDYIIPYSMLPDEPQAEAQRALENDGYETDDELWFPHAVAPTSVVENDGDYYEWEIEREEATSKLRFEETTPTWPGTNDLEVVNETDEPVVVDIVVRDEADNTIFEEAGVEVEPDDEIDVTERPELAVSNEYATFEVAATVDGDPRAPDSWPVTRTGGTQARLHVTEEDVAVEVDHVAVHTCREEYTSE